MSRGVKGLLVVALLGMGEMLLTSCVGVVNQPPVAVLKANPTSGDVPLEVTFDISGSYDPDGGGGTALDWIERPSPEVAGKAGSTGSIVQFSLDFGDGTPAVTGSNIDQPIRHVYRTDGIYSAILTVTDLAQASSTASLQISAYLHSAALLMGPSGGEIELDDGTKLVIEAGFFKSQTDVFFANWSHPAVLPASLSPITLTAEVRFPKEALTGAAEEQLLSIQIPTSAHTDEDYDVAALLFNTGSFRLELFGRYLETADHALIQIPAAIFDEVRDEVRQDIIAMQTLITNVKNYFNIGQHLYRASQDSGGGVALEEITSRVDLEGKTPLILVHGWDAILGDISTDPKKRVISVWGKFLSYILADPLIKDRYQVFAFRYDSDHKITENGKGLSDKVNLAFGTAQNVVILAHSMGGLVARSYMLEHGGEQRVRKLITLGTPNHGSPLANPEIHGISPRCVYGDAFYLTRSDGAQDLRWDDFDGLSGKYPVLLKNEWLSDLNAMPQDNSKIVAYGGIITSLNHRLAYQIGFNCLSGRLGYLLNDGIVPLTSAYYEPHLSSTQERDEQDYDHSQLLGRSNSDPIFTQIRNELLALYPPDNTFSISGRVTLNGVGFSQVGIEISGPTLPECPCLLVNLDDGNYSFRGLSPGTYTLRPISEGYTFDPPYRIVTITNSDVTGQDFVAIPAALLSNFRGQSPAS